MARLFALISVFVGCLCPYVFSVSSYGVSLNSPVLHLRGGLVPQADEAGGDYYEQFELDYGGADKKRVAGATRGFIRSGKLAGLPESDPFKKWLNQHLEKGAEPVSGRIKPFYVRVVLLSCYLLFLVICITMNNILRKIRILRNIYQIFSLMYLSLGCRLWHES